MKKLLFVSDIAGTLDRVVDSDLEFLAEQLLQLKDKYEVDNVIFSLCTADYDPKYLTHYYNKLESVFSKYDITMGRQYYNMGYYEDGEHYGEYPVLRDGTLDKIDTIIEYVKHLQENDEISAVFYADNNMTRKAITGYTESELDDKVYFHFISVEEFKSNISSYNFSASSKENIDGLIQALNFHLGKEEIKDANKVLMDKAKEKAREEQLEQKEVEEVEEVEEVGLLAEFYKKRKKDEKKRLEILGLQKRKLEILHSNQFSDITNDQSTQNYKIWINKIKGMFFNNISGKVLFSENYKDLLTMVSDEWLFKQNDESYSLYEIIKAFDSMNPLTVMLLNCYEVRAVETRKSNDDDYCELCGHINFEAYSLRAPINEDNTMLYINGEYPINMMEYLMRKERIPLYSLVDTLISFNNQYYGENSLGINLRSNSSVNEDLMKRIIAIRESEQYNYIDIMDVQYNQKEKKLARKEIEAKYEEREVKHDDDLPF